ncbi:MAG: L,D-transpeptidase family protein [Solirubrobacteraceae bacterium]
MTLTRSHRRLIVGVLFVAALFGAAIAAAVAYDHGRQDRLAPGIRIGGVDVGGMRVSAARSLLQREAVERRRRTITVRVAGRRFSLPPERSHVTVQLQPALHQALADTRRGWLGARVQRELSGERTDESIALTARYARGVVPKLVDDIGRAVARKPVDASVKPSASGLATVESHTGRALNAGRLKATLASTLIHPSRPAAITATTRSVAPATSSKDLAAKYPAYIVVDRKSHVLRFFQHLEPSRTYPIAVGRSGLETPSGLYDVQWKQSNPSWYVPNSAWAGKLAGTTVPPGPNNPIQARWMAFDGGAGIHGIMPSEYSSIGHDASHGCVRMRIPDVISLYAHTPVHTPVFVA